MRRSADEAIARARALIGTRFRPQGRHVSEGLDCIGVVAAAIGVRNVPCDYSMRGGSADWLAAELGAAGLHPAKCMKPGDVLVLEPGPAQFHLGLFTGASLIHGDAGLRRVVERPAPLPWPILGIWRY